MSDLVFCSVTLRLIISRSRPRTFLRMMESHFRFCQQRRVSLKGSWWCCLKGGPHLFLWIRLEEDCFERLHGRSGQEPEVVVDGRYDPEIWAQLHSLVPRILLTSIEPWRRTSPLSHSTEYDSLCRYRGEDKPSVIGLTGTRGSWYQWQFRCLIT
jgi:hypothetical protein